MAHYEAHLKEGLEDDVADVGPQQGPLQSELGAFAAAAAFPDTALVRGEWPPLATVACRLLAQLLCLMLLALLFPAHVVHGMAHVHQRWCGDEDDL